MHYSTRKKYMTDSDEKVGNSTNPYHSRFFNWIIGGNHRPYSPKCCTIKYSFFPWERDGEIRKKRGESDSQSFISDGQIESSSPGQESHPWETSSMCTELTRKKKVWHTLLYMYRTLQNGRPAGRRKKSRLSKGVSPPKGVFFVGIKIFAKCESLQYTI